MVEFFGARYHHLFLDAPVDLRRARYEARDLTAILMMRDARLSSSAWGNSNRWRMKLSRTTATNLKLRSEFVCCFSVLKE